jgi:hypothetical protein
MVLQTWPATALALLAASGAVLAALAPIAGSAQAVDVRALDGEWLYVEDRTEGRAREDQGPPMSPRLRLRVEEDALVWVRASREERMQIDGSTIEVPDGDTIKRLTGTWKDGLFEYDSEIVKASDGSRVSLLRKAFELTPDGMLVHVSIDPPDAGTDPRSTQPSAEVFSIAVPATSSTRAPSIGVPSSITTSTIRKASPGHGTTGSSQGGVNLP